MERLKNLVESQQLSRGLLEELFLTANDMREKLGKYSDFARGKIMVVLFYEESTRTRLSFQSAMLRLGGNVIVTDNARAFSSVAKGESFEDTIRVVSAYGEAVVLRHDEVGSSNLAAQLIDKPVINAGDGRGQHPTQALLDVYTIQREFGSVDGKKIAIVGDLANGRTVRSLAYLCSKFKGIHLTFVSPPRLRIGNDIKAHLAEHNMPFIEEDDLNKVLPKADVIYMTRIQKERMSGDDYNASKGLYVIDESNLGLIRGEARIMHPLPHVEEIKLPISIEKRDPRIAYFRQAENGLYARMALLHHLLGEK